MSFVAQVNVDVCLVECCDEVETMPPDAAEVAAVLGVENMEVESEEAPEEVTEPNVQTPGPQVPPVGKSGRQPRSSWRTQCLFSR